MPYHLPPEADYFPHPFLADEDGLLAIGGQLSITSLLTAYQHGIFPWYNKDQPILWWFTSPRCVVFPVEVKISKSMRSYFNQNKLRCTMDTQFAEVVNMCRCSTRKNQHGTWITTDIFNAYNEMHEAGHAHSLEVWDGDELVGGLYGIAIGKIFYGESMFSLVSNASKFGFITLCQHLAAQGYQLIDCQQETGHLKSLGAVMISKEDFWGYLQENKRVVDEVGKWEI